MQISGWSQRGRLRALNEDAVGWDAEVGVAVLADGMGGHPAGEVASGLAVRAVLARARRCEGAWLEGGEAPRDLVARAHRAVQVHARRRPETAGMGCTLAVVCVGAEHVAVAHVGDSRVYRLHGGQLQRLTHDHSLAQEAVDRQLLTEDEARSAPQRHRLTRAVGLDEFPEPELGEYPRCAGDLYLLCSDGVTGELDDAELSALVLAQRADLQRSAQALVSAALKAGGADDASVVLARV